MVRCIFLLSVSDRQYRERLIHDSVMAKPWRNQWTANARSRCQLHLRPKLRGLTTRAQDSILPHTLDARNPIRYLGPGAFQDAPCSRKGPSPPER
jgi:hypothetical protein